MVFAPISAQANMAPIFYCMDKFSSFEKTVELDYTIDGGNVVYTCLDEENPKILYMRIEADSDGQLTVEIPRTMVYAFYEDCESQDLSISAEWGEVNSTIENTASSRIITLDFPKGENLISFTGFLYQITLQHVYQYCGEIYGFDSQYLPPNRQVRYSVSSENVRCNEGLELIFKSTDSSPACVKPETAKKLIERGWADTP